MELPINVEGHKLIIRVEDRVENDNTLIDIFIPEYSKSSFLTFTENNGVIVNIEVNKEFVPNDLGNLVGLINSIESLLIPILSSKQNKKEFVEIEDNDTSTIEDAEEIRSPFNPNEIKIIVEPKTIDHLVTRLRYNEIDLNTEFQRKGNLWKPDAQSRLIESILLRFPLPAFYFDAKDEEKWLVIDGLQRLWTIKNFIVNAEKNDPENPPLELKGLEILTDFSNKGITFNKLNRTMQRRILETPITTYLIQPGTPKEVKYNIFRRINTGGLGLNAMEIRHALNQGQPSEFLRVFSESFEFRNLISIKNNRMEDRELILRAIAFMEFGMENYQPSLSSFLDRAMEKLNGLSNSELANYTHIIISAIELQRDIFGKTSMFNKAIIGKPVINRVNSAIFDCWIYAFSKSPLNTIINIKNNSSVFIEEYKTLLKNDDFDYAITNSTANKQSIRFRFDAMMQLFKNFDNDNKNIN